MSGNKSNTHHVVPSADGWDVKRGGDIHETRHFRSREEAIHVGQELSRSQRTELVIHGRDGMIQRKDSYGNDPFPPRG